MTINEFCAKYGIDRSTVYNATWECKRRDDNRNGKNFEYDEDDLVASVRKLIIQRMEMYQTKADIARNALRRLNLKQKFNFSDEHDS